MRLAGKTFSKEELANAITHGIGTLVAIAGLVILVVLTDVAKEPGYLVYAITLVALYSVSTLYHSFTHVEVKGIFRKLDHMAIYLLIAGTYTPFCLSVLDGWLRYTLLSIIWGCAFAGIVSKCFSTGRFEWLSLAFYILMGWMVIFVIKPIYQSLSASGFTFLVAGGAAYTLGTYFYMNERIRFGHAIWHVWVLTGSVFHFFSILTLV